MHVARLHECLMECEGILEAVLRMESLALGELEIIPHELLVVGMHAVLDDGLRTLYGTLAAQVGNALLRGKDLHGMLAVVKMRYHRYYRGNLASLLD